MEGATTSRFQTLGPGALAQPDDAQAGTVALFGMRAALEDVLEQLGAVGTDGAGPVNHAAGSPLKMLLMGLGAVFLERGERAVP